MTGKKFLVYDFGIFTENALALAKDNTCYLYDQWESAFPNYKYYVIGTGTGVDKVTTFWDNVDKVDCIVNFDVYKNDIIAYLREHGYRCFGSGKGAVLENDRYMVKQLLKKLGLPVNNAVKVIGTPNLREYLKRHKDQYVKIDLFRDDLESFHAKDYDSIELVIDELDTTLGPMKDVFPFVVEDEINADESVEPGVDVFFNGKEFIKPMLWGYEICKSVYVGKFDDKVPDVLMKTLDALTPTMRKLDYRGAFSTEEKVVSKDKSYLLDICARSSAPLSNGYPEWVKNYSDIIYKVAGGEDVKIDITNKYVACLPLECNHAENHWIRVILEDDRLRKLVKFRQFVKHQSNYYVVPGMTSVVVIVASGKTIEEPIEKLKTAAGMIEGYGIAKDQFSGLYMAKDEIAKGEKFGLKF